MLLGSTEWAETHADELKKHVILYVNSDTNHRGIFQAGGSRDLEHFINTIAGEIIDPETQGTIGERVRAKLRVDALAPHATDAEKANAKLAADPKRDFPIEAIGSGSDYSSFLDHLGIPSLNLEFANEGASNGVYHSRYDTFEHHSRFVDPGFAYDSLLAKTIGWLVIRAAQSEAPIQQAGDFSEAMAGDVAELKKLADKKRDEAITQLAMLRDRSFDLTADPTMSHGNPVPLKPVPRIDLAPLDKAVDRLKKSAKAYDLAVMTRFAGLSSAARDALRGIMHDIDQTLASDVGLPGRNWYRNLIWAPGRNTGYGVKTLPAVREAIEDERYDEVGRYAILTADVLNAYSARLEQATRVLNGR
jgi:N-acetylated-alpha-linked acidic dipeptidase